VDTEAIKVHERPVQHNPEAVRGFRLLLDVDEPRLVETPSGVRFVVEMRPIP
jgi:hypothetical protein